MLRLPREGCAANQAVELCRAGSAIECSVQELILILHQWDGRCHFLGHSNSLYSVLYTPRSVCGTISFVKPILIFFKCSNYPLLFLSTSNFSASFKFSLSLFLNISSFFYLQQLHYFHCSCTHRSHRVGSQLKIVSHLHR